MYIVDNIINIVAMFVIDTSAKTLTITLAQIAVVKVRFNIDEIYSSTGASHVINLPIKDGMIATGAYVAIIDGVETLLPYSYPTEEPNIVWNENGLLSTMAVGDNTDYSGTIVSQSIVCTPPAPLVEKTGTSSVSYDPNIYSGTWSVRRTLELSYDQGNGLTTKKSIDVTDSHVVYNTNVQALYDAVSVFIQDYIDGCSLCKDSSVFMKLNGYMELFNGYWINGSYEKAYDALYEAGKFVNLSSATVEIEPMMNGIAVHIQNFNNPHKTSFSNIEGYPSIPTNNRFLRDDKTFAEIVAGSGGYAANVYLTNLDSNIPTYKKISYSVEAAETVISITATNESKLVYNYIYDSGVGVTTLYSGAWDFFFNCKLDVVNNSNRIKTVIFKRDISNIETDLITTYSSELVNTDYLQIRFQNIQQNIPVLTTDRIGVRVYFETTNTNPVTFSLKIGDGNASYFTTPLALRHSQLRLPNEDSNVQHLTNAEKTQGALATGNTILPTVKDIADNLELIRTNFTVSLNFVEPYSENFFNDVNFKIISVETNTAQLITIFVNDILYTIGNIISKFNKVTITPETTGYVILNCEVA